MKRGNIYLYLILLFVIFLFISIYIPGKGISNDFINTVLAIASFIFGVIIAFSISNRHSRLSNIRSSLRKQDALFLELFFLSKSFGKEIQEKIKMLIDRVLISQIDFKLIDFNKESPIRIKNLCLFIEKLKVKNKNQEETKDKMLDCNEELLEIQKEVEYEVRNQMMLYEWISTLILGIIIIFCLFYINNNSLISIIVIPFLSTALVLLILVLEQLDSLKFQEQNWIWEPLSQLFLELDLLPYFPDAIFKQNRIKMKSLKKFGKLRIAHYPNPYPNMAGKKIEIVKL